MFLSKSSALCVLSLFIMSCNGMKTNTQLDTMKIDPAELDRLQKETEKKYTTWECIIKDGSSNIVVNLPENDVIYLKESGKKKLKDRYCSSIFNVQDYGVQLNLLQAFETYWKLKFTENPFLPRANDNAPMPWATYVQKGFPYAVALGLTCYFLKMLIEKNK